MTAGYTGGQVDNLLMRLTDVIYAFPDLLFFIIVMVSLRETPIGQLLNGLFLLFVALAIVNWVGVARLVRGQVLSLKQKEFVEAGRMIGAPSTPHHVPPPAAQHPGRDHRLDGLPHPGDDHHRGDPGLPGPGPAPGDESRSFFITSWGALLLEGQTAINAQPGCCWRRRSAWRWW